MAHPAHIDTDSRAVARDVLVKEAAALSALAATIGTPFDRAVDLLLAVKGRIVVTGMGKSGHIGAKIAATLASTGTPAFFVHPGEASHGDLGMITDADAVLALSHSGETRELGDILAYCQRFGVPLVALTGKAESTLAKAATVTLLDGVTEEACPLNLAPTTSTTAMLATRWRWRCSSAAVLRRKTLPGSTPAASWAAACRRWPT